MNAHQCRQCHTTLDAKHLSKRYCSRSCKNRFYKENPALVNATEHVCRQCGKRFPIGPGQFNKWLCSAECRRAKNTQSVREFHNHRPLQEAIYRRRTREKIGPDSVLRCFYLWNPHATKSCESCGEVRVLDVAYKPSHARLGEPRKSSNCKWPYHVWVLCPTCHALIGRMNYPPIDLGLTE